MDLEVLVLDDDLAAILKVPNAALDRPHPLGNPGSLALAMGREIVVAAERSRRGMPPLEPMIVRQGENSGVINIDENAVAEVLDRLNTIVGG